MSDWKTAITDEWQQRNEDRSRVSSFFPLIDQTFAADDILAMADVLLSGQLTMAHNVRAFEKKFAEYVGAPYAVMVNSGSSANLLAMAVACNPMRADRLVAGDEVLVPAVCWSTSVWPIFQFGLKPVFVDVDPKTLNVDIKDLQAKITPKTKGFMAVHVLGNSAPISALKAVVAAHKLIWIEDTCESLGSRAEGKVLGTIGDFGTYSFYYSHHMTTGEGGMVTCRTLQDADLLKCLRAHGWTRELSNKPELEKKHAGVDPRFLFVNVGYNLRPMEIQAALGLNQLSKLSGMNDQRIQNRASVVKAIKAHPEWQGQFEFIQPAEGTEPVWFGFCALIAPKYAANLEKFLGYLTANGVENRPVVSGNFARQPALAMMGVNIKPSDFTGAEAVHHRGFFIGLHTDPLHEDTVRKIADILLKFDFKS